jgi:hypothetical protein
MPFVKILITLAYLIFYSPKQAWTGSFIWYAYLFVIPSVLLTFYFDGVQDTVRNISRIYLLRKYGLSYDNVLFERIRDGLISERLMFRTLAWRFLENFSFFVILFIQGWLIAVIVELLCFLSLFLRTPFLRKPNYSHHINEVKLHVTRVYYLSAVRNAMRNPDIKNSSSDVIGSLDYGILLGVIHDLDGTRDDPSTVWAKEIEAIRLGRK